MARKKVAAADNGFFLVNVLYEDGSQRSNRKIQKSQLSGFDDKADILEAIEQQDQKIADLSGQARAPIASIARVGKR
jgi:hypothetical protein